MEAKVAALDVRVDNLEQRMDKHEADDERFHKYNSHMLEDLLGKIVKIEISAARFETDLVHRNGSDKDVKEALGVIRTDLDVIRRLVWMALGGVLVIAGIVGVVGGNIMSLLGGR